METEERREGSMSQRPLEKKFWAEGKARSFKRYRKVSSHEDGKVPADLAAEGR